MNYTNVIPSRLQINDVITLNQQRALFTTELPAGTYLFEVRGGDGYRDPVRSGGRDTGKGALLSGQFIIVGDPQPARLKVGGTAQPHGGDASYIAYGVAAPGIPQIVAGGGGFVGEFSYYMSMPSGYTTYANADASLTVDGQRGTTGFADYPEAGTDPGINGGDAGRVWDEDSAAVIGSYAKGFANGAVTNGSGVIVSSFSHIGGGGYSGGGTSAARNVNEGGQNRPGYMDSGGGGSYNIGANKQASLGTLGALAYVRITVIGLVNTSDLFVKYDEAWCEGEAYAKVNGVWQPAQLFAKKDGTWQSG